MRRDGKVRGRRHVLEPRNIGKASLATVNVDAAEFGASMQRWKDLAGIEQALRVEGAFEALLLLQVVLAEHGAHQVALFDTDTVLAGQNAADLDAEFQDIGAEILCFLQLAQFVGIIEN